MIINVTVTTTFEYVSLTNSVQGKKGLCQIWTAVPLT